MKLAPSNLILRCSGLLVSISLCSCQQFARVNNSTDLPTLVPANVSAESDTNPPSPQADHEAAFVRVVSATEPALQVPGVLPLNAVAHPMPQYSIAPSSNVTHAIQTTRLPKSPRVVLAQAGFPSTESDGSGGAVFDPEHADEYIFDGGDRDLPVHYSEFTRQGLDTEDTIAEYTNEDGKEFVRVSNRVAIYSPRFGAVRTVGSTEGNYGVQKGNVSTDLGRTGRFSSRTSDMQKIERLSVHNALVRTRGSAFLTRKKADRFHTGDMTATVDIVRNVYENIGSLRRGEFDQTAEAQLAKAFKAAERWTTARHPVITASTSGSHEATKLQKHENAIVIDPAEKTPGDLRIFKLADKVTAQPGDVITFTLRYENVGQEELLNVRIVDNLTPRLEYVEDSVQSDRPATIAEEDNAEGSLVLLFELEGPLPGETAGVIRFQCRVR